VPIVILAALTRAGLTSLVSPGAAWEEDRSDTRPTSLTDTESLRLDPKTVLLTFATSPTGLQLTVGSSSGAAPFTRTVIEGSTTSVSAPSPQTLGGRTYDFVSWSDGEQRRTTSSRTRLRRTSPRTW
jgi:hypothetical protein